MIAYTFNSATPAFSLGWEALALRTGLCLSDDTCCVGPSVHTINYQNTTDDISPTIQLKALLEHVKDESHLQALQNANTVLRHIRSHKHRSKQDIVMLKHTEKLIRTMYSLYRDELLAQLSTTGLPQLGPFSVGDDQCLFPFMTENDLGEPCVEGSLSRLLSFETEEDDEPEPTVIIFYEKLGHEVREKYDCTPLAVLPNMNMLTTEQLRNLRQRLEPQRQELESLLAVAPPDAQGRQYHSSTWNLEGVRQLGPRLQQAFDATPELEWVANLQTDIRAELLVGNMPCTELWQLLHTHGVMPNDSWQLLQQKQQSGIHCPTIPFITITSDWALTALDNLTEEQVLTHKRKTIDLD